MKLRNNAEHFTVSISTSEGEFSARYSEKGLCGLSFPHRGDGAIQANTRADVPAEISHWHKLTIEALDNCLEGKAPKELPPLDLSAGTEFQQDVWRALLEIGPGETMSYGEVARAIGNPKALRAVGGACGANPIPVLVPCHRVLAAHRQIGGFSSGLDWKRRLLQIEAQPYFESPTARQS